MDKCKNCGACPHCGQVPFRAYPYYQPPYYVPYTVPINPGPFWQVPNTTISGGTGNLGINHNPNMCGGSTYHA